VSQDDEDGTRRERGSRRGRERCVRGREGGREGRRTQKRLSAGDGSGDGWNVGSAFDDVTAFLKPFVAVVLLLWSL
jgi:hypothetical protein